MKRRDFVKSLPALALAPNILCQSNKLPPIHLIALGSVANKIVEKNIGRLKVNSLTLINDFPPKKPVNSSLFFSFLPPDSAFMNLDGRRFLKHGPLPEIDLSFEIVKHLYSLEGRVIVFAALGKGTGTILYQAVAKYINAKGLSVDFLCTWPFGFEGKYRSDHAERSSDYVHQHFNQKIFPLEYIRILHGNIPLKTAFEKADELVFENMERAINETLT